MQKVMVLLSLGILAAGFVYRRFLDERPLRVQILDLIGRDYLGHPATPLHFEITRAEYELGAHLVSKIHLDSIRIKDLEIPTQTGHSLRSRLYLPYPKGARDVQFLPVVVFFHGGGWVQGGIITHDAMCVDISKKSKAVVISVAYRLAPETKFPGQIEDAYDAVRWAFQNVHQFHGDVGRIIVAGDSAGGNLAAGVCLMARDKGHVPPIAYQILIYPALDPTCSTESYRKYGENYFLYRSKMIWFWDQYLSKEEDRKNPYAVPIAADNYLMLPPALILVSEWDVLRDEGFQYGKYLRRDGIQVEVTQYNKTLHGFLSTNRFFQEEYDSAIEEIAHHINNCEPVIAVPERDKYQQEEHETW